MYPTNQSRQLTSSQVSVQWKKKAVVWTRRALASRGMKWQLLLTTSTRVRSTLRGFGCDGRDAWSPKHRRPLQQALGISRGGACLLHLHSDETGRNGWARKRVMAHSVANLQRQLAEVEILRSIYAGEGEFDLDFEEEAAFKKLDEYCSCEFSGVAFTVHLTSVGNVSVNFVFPDDYPESQAARVNVRCRGDVVRKQHDDLNLAARAVAENAVGQESALQVLQKVQDLAWEISDERPTVSKASVDGMLPLVLKRKLFWFHHIKSTRKRKCIVEWGKELHIGGYCKPGFPGILIVEGEDMNITEYVKRVRHLRWQAMNLRALEEEQCTEGQSVDDLRRFPVGVEELGESAMSQLGALCREAKLEHMFLAALKIGSR